MRIYQGHTTTRANADLDALIAARVAGDAAEATARAAGDVPNLRQWGQNPATTVALVFGYFGGQAWTAAGVRAASANGTIALANNATSYVERTLLGAVTANVVGFTDGLLPMAIVVTVAGAITTVADAREFSLGYTPPVTGEVGVTNTSYAIGDPRRHGAKGDGVTDDRGAFANADTSAVALGGGLAPGRGTYLIGSNITLASVLTMGPSAKLKLGAGATVSVSSRVIAGVYQIFDASPGGALVFTASNPVAVEVEWWGTGATGPQQAANAMPPVSGGELRLNTFFPVNTPLRIMQSNVALVGRRNANNGFQQARFTGNIKGPMCYVGTTICTDLVASLVGGVGQAISLPGDFSRYIDLQDANTCELNGRAALTIEFFHKYFAAPGATAKFMSSYGHFYNGEPEVAESFYLRVTPANAIEAALKVGATLWTLASANNVLVPNAVQHIALSYDGATIRLFVDGVLVASQAAAGTITQLPKERFLLAGPQNSRPFGVLGPSIANVWDSVRILSTARYVAGFVAPTVKFATDASTMLLVNFDSVTRGLIQCQTGAAGTAWLVYRNGGDNFFQNIRVEDIGFENTAGGIGLLVNEAPYGEYRNISASGRIGMYFLKNLFLCNFKGLKVSSNNVDGRIGILFEKGISGSAFHGFDVEGYPYGVWDGGGLSCMKDGFVNTQPDTIIPIIVMGGTNSTIDNMSFDDEGVPAAGVVRKCAIMVVGGVVQGIRNSRIMWGISAGASPPILFHSASFQGDLTLDNVQFELVTGAVPTEIVHVTAESSFVNSPRCITINGCVQKRNGVWPAIPWVNRPEFVRWIGDRSGLAIGGRGTPLTGIVAYAPVLAPAAVGAASISRQTFAVPGLAVTDRLVVNPPAAAGSVGVIAARASAADTLELTFSNPTAGALTPTAGVYPTLAFGL